MTTSKPLDRPSILVQGHATYLRFTQAKFWWDSTGQSYEVEAMDPRHRINTIRYLERHADRISFLYGLGEIVAIEQGSFAPSEGSEAERAVDDMLDERWQQQIEDPVAWIRTTPLMKALRRVFNRPPPKRNRLDRMMDEMVNHPSIRPPTSIRAQDVTSEGADVDDISMRLDVADGLRILARAFVQNEVISEGNIEWMERWARFMREALDRKIAEWEDEHG